jgi:CubicO group peptidase (beta-lactamase class C family)
VVRVPVRHDSLFNFFSASKAVTAMVIHLLDERGAVHLDDAVAEYFPEFGKHGKEDITIRQLLTHRAGIPVVKEAKVDAALLGDHDRLMALLCDAKPISVPGRQLAYHALTSGFVLAEVVQRATGRDIRRVLRDEILGPLGFATFDYGIAPERVKDVAVNAFTGLPSFPPQSWALERALGLGAREASAMSNDPRFLTAIVPSGNVIGTADEACRFFQLLLDEGELGGVRVFEKRTVRRAVREQSYLEVDSFLGLPVRYGMGFMLGGEHFTPYGPHTPRAFGHLGFTNVIAWADPERQLSVGLMTSGKPFITPGQIAWLRVARTISDVCPRAAA